MSVPSKQGNRAGERNRSKFRAAGDVGNNPSKGSGANQQKLSAGRYQHGIQVSRKTVRHMPPPVNLPSLKAENARLGLDIGVTTPELSGCEHTDRTNQNVSGQNLFFSSYEQSGFPTQKSNVSEGQSSAADYGQHMKRSGTLADQKLRRFQEDFPQLSSIVEGPVAVSKSEDRSAKSSYGPGPSLRPQNVSTWREGGGSGILQTSPPMSPTNQSAQTSGTTVGGTLVASSGNSSSPTESANISTNVGMSRDEVTTQDDGRACQEVQKMAAPANGQVPAHIAVRPGLQPGVNKWMEFQTPTIPYPGMMMPPYGFGPGFGHPPYPAGFMYPVMSRMPLINPLNAGFHAFQPPAEKAAWGLSDTADKSDLEAFKSLTLSGHDEFYSRSDKSGHGQRSAGEAMYGQHLDDKLAEDLRAQDYRFNKTAGSVSSESDEIFGQKNQAVLTNGMKSSHGVGRSLSTSETSDTQQSRNYVDGHLPLRSISNPSSSEEVEDSLQYRRKQQSELMLAAVERARKRREEEERLLKEKQLAAASEKLRQLEEKLGKKPHKEAKTSETDSCGSECSKPQDEGGKSSRPSTVIDNDEDVKSLDVESSSLVNDGYYAKNPYATQPEHLHRLPSPKCWSEHASNTRMTFPQFPPVDPYFYWRHYIESGGGMPFYPGMRMPFVPVPPDFPAFKGGNNVSVNADDGKKIIDSEHVSPRFGMVAKSERNAAENAIAPASNKGKSVKVEDNSKPDECLSDSRAWNAFNSYWVQPKWMKYESDDKTSGSIENQSESMKSGGAMKDQSQDSGGRHGIDPRDQQRYYQVWWNFNPSSKTNDSDSPYAMRERNSTNGTQKSAAKIHDNSDLSMIERPGMAFNKSTSGRYHSANDPEPDTQTKYISHRPPGKGKPLDTLSMTNVGAKELEFEPVDNKTYSSIKHNTVSSGTTPINQKIKVIEMQPQIVPYQDDQFERQSSSSHSGKPSRDTFANRQGDQRRVKNYQADDVSKSRNVHEKLNTGSLKTGNFKFADRKELIEDVFWERSASKDAKALIGNDSGENGWDRSNYGEYRGYY